MTKGLALVAALLFIGLALWLALPLTSKPGIELGYVPLWEAGMKEGARDQALADTVKTMKRRLRTAGVECEVAADAAGVRVKLPGATPETVASAKRLLRISGNLQLRPAAPLELQEKFNRDGVVPEGYAVVENPDKARGGEYEAWGKRVLLRIEPVIRSRLIAGAEPIQEMVPGGSRWVTSFELNDEAAKRFDAAAEELYNRRPPGLLGIVLDGELKSLPAVQSPSFHGHGQISGAKSEEDARDLALILKNGEFTVPLGSRKDGKDLPGVPEFERPYGPKK